MSLTCEGLDFLDGCIEYLEMHNADNLIISKKQIEWLFMILYDLSSIEQKYYDFTNDNIFEQS